MICVTGCMQHGCFLSCFFFPLFEELERKKRKKKKTEQEKNSNTFTQQLTNQGRVLFSCFFFFLDLAKNILCMLTNSF